MTFSAVWSGSTVFAILSSLVRDYTICHSQQSDQGQGPHCHSQEQSGQGLQYLSVSKVWSGSTLFATEFLSSLINVYTVCHSQQSDRGLHFLPFSVWSGSTVFPFSAVWSGSTLFPVLSKYYYKAIHCLPFLAVWLGRHYLPFSAVWSRSRSSLWFAGTVTSGSTLFAILNSLIRVYTVCLSPQQSDQGLLCLPFFLRIIIKVYTVCHSQQSDQGLHYLPFSAVWSGTTLFDILSSLIKVKVHTVILRNCLVRVYSICHSQKSDLNLHCLPFSAVWTTSTLFAILGSPIRSILFAILSSLIRVCTICHSQQSDQGLHYLPFSQSSIIKVYTACNSQQSDKGYTTWLSQQSNQGQGLQCHFQKQSDQGLHFLPSSAV